MCSAMSKCMLNKCFINKYYYYYQTFVLAFSHSFGSVHSYSWPLGGQKYWMVIKRMLNTASGSGLVALIYLACLEV